MCTLVDYKFNKDKYPYPKESGQCPTSNNKDNKKKTNLLSNKVSTLNITLVSSYLGMHVGVFDNSCWFKNDIYQILDTSYKKELWLLKAKSEWLDSEDCQ